MSANIGPNSPPAARARDLSRYARRLLEAEPYLLSEAEIAAPLDRRSMLARLPADNADDAALMRALRVLRKHVMLRLITRDLGGLASLEEVVTTISTLAEIAVELSVSHLETQLAADYGVPIGADSGQIQHLHVVGMGKLGGNELNVSSDIDLVFAYPEDGETQGARPMSNHEFFARLGRRLITIINEITADGYVFRVDMRLRPLGADGPLACSFAMFENYFITQGREWERYAWIKGRVLCGDRASELAELAAHFVFRRHLDYSAFESLRDLHQQVRREVERRDMQDNIKLGPGGIREVEFIAQLFQLVRGGRDNALRTVNTLQVLPLIAERNLLPAAAVTELMAAYAYLRNLEHRLQYLDDKQTQALPTLSEDQTLIAAAMNAADYPAMLRELDAHRAAVTRHFEGIFADARSEDHPLACVWLGGDDAALHAEQSEKLRALGYTHPAAALAAINGLRNSNRIRQMPEVSHARMARLVPLIVEQSAKCPNPEATLERMLHLVESISRRESYLALLLQYPQTIARSANLAGASPWAADYLARHPILLDELLDSRNLHEEPDWPRLEAPLQRQLAEAAGDRERQMDALRHFKHTQTLRLLALDLGGELTLERLSDHLSALADLILAATLELTWKDLTGRHCDEPRFIIVAYGKLGGKELGYASDLDLIFLHQDTAAEAPVNYARLAQRMNSALSSVTAAGVLYETDLRLRPDGASGLLVSPLESFAAYQHDHAWVWEHQALTRARFVAGDRELGRAFEALRAEVLRRPRALDPLRQEIVAMRQTMLEAHPNVSGQFDIKHDRGGLIDVEFIVQYLVLGYAHQDAELTGNIGNLALLKLAASLGLIEHGAAQAVRAAYHRYRTLQHALRLQGDRYARVNDAEITNEKRAVTTLWKSVLETTATP
jgi:[glutamine synthetase] adenylyltransferase / [glutamine synthetase]-adenylyl-L-tyrosine phosphorylase